MSWNKNYWDIIEHYYWIPSYMGMQSINQRLWERQDDLICVPRDSVSMKGPLYSRKDDAKATLEKLGRYEEPLNDFFNLTFAIAPDEVIARLLFEPAGITDCGPFEMLGGIEERYGWESHNITNHDAFIRSSSSLLGIELKLKANSSPAQILKYLTLLMFEEKYAGKSDHNVALLFIAPPQVDESRFWGKCGLEGPYIDPDFFTRVDGVKLNGWIRSFLEDYPNEFRELAERVRLTLMTWQQLLDGIDDMMQRLDQSAIGEQTLYRLLIGFRNQLREHGDTGIELNQQV